MNKSRGKGNGHITRRRLLKGAATGAGLAVGSGLVKGFPTIWAQNIKDIKLVQVGGSYSAIKEIGRQATKDLGFTGRDAGWPTMTRRLNRLLTQPKTIDINDIEFVRSTTWSARKIVQPIPARNTSCGTRPYRSSPRASIPTDARSRHRASRRSRCSIWTDKDGNKLRQAGRPIW